MANVFAGRVAMPARTRVTQAPDGPYTLGEAAELIEILVNVFKERQERRPEESPSDWGLVTFRVVREAIEKQFPGINARHYGNQTGSNALENVAFHVVAGDFKPNPHGFLEEAQAIWGDSARVDGRGCNVALELADKTGKTVKLSRRGYKDPRLDARWLEVTAGEVRQAVGRGRPWNTGQQRPEQGDLFAHGTPTKQRHLDVLILSSYALDGIVPDELTGERADLEDTLATAAVELRRAGQMVTRAALQERTGIADRQIRQRFDRVKLRSEAEFLALSAALNSSPALNVAREVLFVIAVPEVARCSVTATCDVVVDPPGLALTQRILTG